MSKTSMKRQLEPEQEAAAHEITKHISVTAGPGSGKTTVLVERYLHILRQHPQLSIDQIVAITFTNRAANEMRERLRQELNVILQTVEARERRQWLNYKRTLDGAVITTIHGFCARLLREFPVEAHVDPQFLLLDEHRAAMLLEGVVEETLTEFISADHKEISRLTLGVGRGKLAAALAQLHREVRGQGISAEDLARRTADSHASETDHERAVSELKQELKTFAAIPRTTPAARAKLSQLLDEWSSVGKLLCSIPDIENVAEYCRVVETFRDTRPSATGNLKPHIELLDELIWAKELCGRVPQIALDLFAKHYALEMALLLRRIDERLAEEKQKLSALDFDDLELRTLELLQRPEVLARTSDRYKFFLVDEFQDTNAVQRRLLELIALRASGRDSANVFIVGDQKQSIYGFRGADVTVFSEMTGLLRDKGGEAKPLLLNFRSQPPLISFFNRLFSRLFQTDSEIPPSELQQLGYVSHEYSEAKREPRDEQPLVELMITTEGSADEDDPKAEQNSRELDAEQVARRIVSLIETPHNAVKYSDIALLFRAMTHVQKYEAAFRRAHIPYQTVLGRGFYKREEITDLIQLLRFLDNKTDELALAAVLRSPLCGISDNALLALRCAPWQDELQTAADPLKHFSQTRKIYRAVLKHDSIAFISDEEHLLLDRAARLLTELINRQHHYSLSALLRYAVEQSEYTTVVAATFDGAQRLANVHRLFTLAERFENSGSHLIRDFVRYVEEFEAIGSRESEGQIDESANAVKLMTIHQAKGLEFPIVFIPDLQRWSRPPENWVLLDRQRGVTLKVPDGRGRALVAGLTFNEFEKRQALRETFESMRLLYVAATRAEDRLVLSGTIKDLTKAGARNDNWLNWIWQSLELPPPSRSGVVQLSEELQLQLTINIADDNPLVVSELPVDTRPHAAASADSILEAFPLIAEVGRDIDGVGVHRFSVTQLINYQRCARQYYFDRVLHAPSPDALAIWNNAEAPEPPANLTATLKGAVIHRFCETYGPGDDPETRLQRSFDEIVHKRQGELADRVLEINREEAIAELLPLARNYLASSLYERIENARANFTDDGSASPASGSGLWSELAFRLRRPLGVLSGAIDKLLITPSRSGNGFDIEIVDFKTNRLTVDKSNSVIKAGEGKRKRPAIAFEQIGFDFDAPALPIVDKTIDRTTEDRVQLAALDYQLQMQGYALAVRELLPPALRNSTLTSTLHFLEPNVESHLSPELLSTEACAEAIDKAMRAIVSSREPAEFPVDTSMHCRTCGFLSICRAGRDWVRANPSTPRASERFATADAGRQPL